METRKALSIVLFIVIIIIVMTILYLVIHFVLEKLTTDTYVFLGSGWLGNPFRTTRKMKVPARGAKGHAERNFETFIAMVIRGVIIIVLWTLYLLWQK